ncbi:pimeloyl-ACP methyl ester carboxylesterase [Microbacterium terrae]|uniref:Pimeloyl-[acyl-carrier protein] methyl ester esterase n=1 Tax=Microbacterium terrae TaxID=69369 RepID=A0A0M2HAK3_9MICO|nr:alpha/beta hydrolase [Microbacterium terrae]KJL43508.1 Pimeloyl-[acyl-carrier protein] methyl ester esterase [Microbacterium terrae]MBP1077888.1 pimeloyl-ACP methyl ester carboxylesterase [Microbacterium terrae]GLK00059.1 alpha/beta hydrolase [Microbacterium terrae]
MSEPVDEFSFLPEQAADAGIAGPVPTGERLTLTLDGGRTLSALRYGDAPPLVTFLHGAGLNAHTWDTTILALGLAALAIDLPGHGDSSWRDDMAYTARPLAADVAEGIAAWTDRPQLLVGQSLGGLTAAALAAARPDLVRELVVVDITPGVDPNAGPTQIRDFFAGPTDWATRDELVDRALAFGLGGGTRRKAARGVYFNSRVRPDGRVEWKHHFAHLANTTASNPAAAEATAAQQDAVASVLGESGWDDLAAVTAPTTLIRGERGYVTEADAAEFTRRLPTASVLTLPAGHNVQEDAPLDLGALLARRADGE